MLGNAMTIGDAVRLIEQHPYVVVCHRSGEEHRVNGMREAMAVAKAMATRSPGDAVHIHLPGGGPRFTRDSLVASVRRAGGTYEVRFNQQLHGLGLGDALTDWACSSAEFVDRWKSRVNAGISTGTQAAVLGAAAAGAIGALINRPLLGAVVGAAVGWGTHAIWTGPQRIA